MSNLEDFRSSINESFPEDREVKPAELPQHYLGSISLYVMLGVFCSAVTYALLWQFPGFLNLFYTDISAVEIRTAPFTAACAFFGIGVPLIVSFAFRKHTIGWMFPFLIIVAVIFGAGLAFICVPLGWNFILLPLLALALSHWVMAILFAIVEDLYTGKFSTGILLTTALLLMFIAGLFFDLNWICWSISLVFFFIAIYVGYNPRTMKRNYQSFLLKQLPYNETVLAEALNLFMVNIVIIFPLAFATHGFNVVARQRRWIGPEDQ